MRYKHEFKHKCKHKDKDKGKHKDRGKGKGRDLFNLRIIFFASGPVRADSGPNNQNKDS